MADFPRFITIGDLLVDIASGLGEGHRRLIDASQSPIGTLVVKEALVKVSFEMTSAATHRTDTIALEGPSLGAKTLSIGASTSSSQTDDRMTNRAEVTLTIVNVAPAPAAAPEPAAGTPAKASKPSKDQMAAAITALGTALNGAHINPADKKALRTLLANALYQLNHGDAASASRIIAEFTKRMKRLAPS